LGIRRIQRLVNITIEDYVFYDDNAANEQHEVYIGSRTIPSSNVTVHRVIAYNSNSYPIFQFNGDPMRAPPAPSHRLVRRRGPA
jgi:hypothetical protein